MTVEKMKSKILKAGKSTAMNAIIVTENGNELDELFKDTKALAIDCYVLKGGYKQWVDAGLLPIRPHHEDNCYLYHESLSIL